MFHNNSSSFGTSITRTPGSSMIHNDENAMSMSSNLHSHKSLSSKKQGSNTLISKPSFANMNAKTPLNKKTTNTRRRALGDISNRKGGGTDSGFHGANSKRNGADGGGKSGKEKGTDIFIDTPHKISDKSKPRNANNVKIQKSNHQKFPSSTTRTGGGGAKKKQVSFAIHTSSDLTSGADIVQKKNQPINLHKQGTAVRSKSRLRRRDVEEDMEDIELSAGRTWAEEQKLMEDNLDDVNLSIDVGEGLDAIREMKEQGKRDAMKNLRNPMSEEELKLDHDAVLEALMHIEYVDDDILYAHSMIEEHDNVFGSPLGGIKGDDEDLEHLIGCIDDISL